MPDIDSTAVSGVEVVGYRKGSLATDSWVQYVVPTTDRIVSYRGRTSTFRIPGAAGTTGQNLMSIHNATGSTILVDVDHISVDKYETVVKAVTAAPPIMRLHRVTALPGGGAAIGKNPEDTSLSSSASLTILQGASADGTAVALTATIPANSVMSEEFAPRLITAAGYEPQDQVEMIRYGFITLRALEGLVVRLDYAAAASNPVTDMWVCTIHWDEYTRP